RFIRRERRRIIHAAILRVSLTHRVNGARIDAFLFERLIGPSGDDVGDEALGVLSRRSFVVGDGGIEEHDFAQRLAQTGLREPLRKVMLLNASVSRDERTAREHAKRFVSHIISGWPDETLEKKSIDPRA